uniref:DRBM domain-containing protein n=2 Tax=Oryza punctata TaxID=4537 RepID=A0A0E0LUH9_ORYPU
MPLLMCILATNDATTFNWGLVGHSTMTVISALSLERGVVCVVASCSVLMAARPRCVCVAHCNYKNKLQEYLQQANKQLPIYCTKCKGEHHQLKFKSTVMVDGEEFSSTSCHRRVKDAEQDAAKVAYDALLERKETDDTDVFELIDQDVVFSKSILHEFTTKTKTDQPSYSITKKEGSMIPYVASVSLAGRAYTGVAARNKKDAEQKAARAAVKSLLATNDTCMEKIVRSKEKLISANSPSGYNKEIDSNPTNTALPFAPIKFTSPAVFKIYDGENDMVSVPQALSVLPAAEPASNPSEQAVHVSKKHKDNKVSEPEVKEERELDSIFLWRLTVFGDNMVLCR